VKQVHAESHGIYGSLKIAKQLWERPDLESACRNTVAQAMPELGLKSRVPKTFTPTTTQSDPTNQPAPNELYQDFTAAAPNRKKRSLTSPTWQPRRAGFTWPSCSICSAARSWVGR
jgi:putative transposase